MTLDAAALEAAEAACAQEPIHIPGAIQPHGILLALDVASGAVLAASANAPLPANAAAQPSLASMLGDADARRIRGALAAGDTADTLEGLATADGRAWAGSLRPAGTGIALLELEPASDDAARAHSLRSLDAALDRLGRAPDPAAAAAVAAASVRAMTGFDRVMVYRFMPDWAGEVLAESLRDDATVDSFLGLRFPASDIPPQARALYRDNRVRLIPDSHAAALPLAAVGTGLAAPLDLSAASLRAVSPVHLRYLRNMGVRASMSVAVPTQAAELSGELWGLIACHHQAGPRLVAADIRHAAELLGRVLSWRLGELAAAERAQGRARLGEFGERLAIELGDPERPIGETVGGIAPALAGAVGAHAFLLVPDPARAEAEIPEVPEASSPGTDLERHLAALAPDGSVETDRAGSEAGPELGGLLEAAGWCGLLATRVIDGDAASPGTWAVWLRRELRRDVVWAGNPVKEIEDIDPARLPSLSPRRSFAAWREEVRGRAAPFTTADRAAASAISGQLARGLLRRSAAIDRNNRELRSRNEAIRFFADAAVHDLREPLWQIQVFAGMLREDLEQDPDLSKVAHTVATSAERMRDMLDDLANYASAGHDRERMARAGVVALIERAADEVAEKLRLVGGTLRIGEPGAGEGALPEILCDPGHLARVFQNLLANAISYRAPSRPLLLEIACRREGPDQVRIEVADNGIGFAPAERERIFEPFRRLHDPGAGGTVGGEPSRGMGLGLAICRRIVEAHGGSVVAAALPGRGATFTILLPIGPAPGGARHGEETSMSQAPDR